MNFIELLMFVLLSGYFAGFGALPGRNVGTRRLVDRRCAGRSFLGVGLVLFSPMRFVIGTSEG